MKDLQDTLIYKADDKALSKMKQLKDDDKDLETAYKWLEEYSMAKSKQKDNIESVLMKQYYSQYTSNDKSFLESASDTPKNIKQANSTYLDFSEECIVLIENPNFDIFKLEDEVGKENTLSTISCYIFITFGLYSIINYNNFERFLQAITQGYNRNIPYHNVYKY